MLQYRIYNCHGAIASEGVPAMIEHVKWCMRDAVELNMNMFVMAREWPIQFGNVVQYKYFEPLQKYVDAIKSAECIAAYGELSAYADSLGLPFYPSLTEFYIPKEAYKDYPDWMGRREEAGIFMQPGCDPCFSHPFTKAHFQAKVREICEIVPDAAGLELWMGEKESSALYCMCEKCRGIPSSERILSLIMWAYETMKKYDPRKRLIVRSYLCAGRCYYQPEVFLPIAGRLPKDIIFAVKGQYGDFMYLNDMPPLAGKFDCDMVAEFDLGGENRGFYYGYYSAVTDYTQQRMEALLKTGAKGFMFRHIDWLGDVNRAEAYAIARWMCDQSRPAREYETEYLAEKFGAEAVRPLGELMRAGADVCEKDIHILGCNAFSCFGTFPDTMTRFKYNVFDHCARMIGGAEARLLACIDNPSPALEEKDGALAFAEKFDGLLESVRGLLPEHTYEGLKISSSVMQMIVEPHKLLTELLFAYMKYERALYSDEKLRSIYRLKNIIGRLRTWVQEKGAALKSADLPKMRELQGIHPIVRAHFDKWHPYVNTDILTALCGKVENSFDEKWDYFNWNIII